MRIIKVDNERQDRQSMYDLSPEARKLLVSLYAIGAATPMELAIRTGLIGQDLRPMLQRLLESGLVMRATGISGYENEIYLVSSRGRKLLS